jgi:hypothetical protein
MRVLVLAQRQLRLLLRLLLRFRLRYVLSRPTTPVRPECSRSECIEGLPGPSRVVVFDVRKRKARLLSLPGG